MFFSSSAQHIRRSSGAGYHHRCNRCRDIHLFLSSPDLCGPFRRPALLRGLGLETGCPIRKLGGRRSLAGVVDPLGPVSAVRQLVASACGPLPPARAPLLAIRYRSCVPAARDDLLCRPELVGHYVALPPGSALARARRVADAVDGAGAASPLADASRLVPGPL